LPNEPLITVTAKGIDTIRDAAKMRNNRQVLENVRARQGEADVLVHAECRKRFTDKRELAKIDQAKKTQDTPEPDRPVLRSMEPAQNFDFKTHCFLCAGPVGDKYRHPGAYYLLVRFPSCKHGLFPKL
jgi:hypothetical protein